MSVAEPTGTVAQAVQHAARLLADQPALALEQAEEILKVAPNQPAAQLLRGVAQRQCGQLEPARTTLAALSAAHAPWALAHYEHALTLGRLGEHEAAIRALQRATQLKPQMADAWRSLGDELLAVGDAGAADTAYAESIRASTQDPQLLAAAGALCANRIPEAEHQLRAILRQRPSDVAALRMLAEVAARLRRYGDAATLLVHCLELAPGFKAARHNYAVVLHRLQRPAEALAEIEKLLADDARNPGYLNLKAAVLARMGDYHDSLEVYAAVLAAHPNQPKVWMSYGHALKTSGRREQSIAAYRRAIEQLPSLGESYWSLANLKTFRFEPAELEAMRAQLARTDLGEEDRYHLEFALGKALEDAHAYADSFAHYAAGNRLRRQGITYEAAETTRDVERTCAVATREFFAARKGFGNAARDPIFVVGLPRAGSTLIEQILASHPDVEGTMELPTVSGLSKALRELVPDAGDYPENLAALTAEQARALGQRYLDDTRVHRKRGTPLFIDKMPNNFAHVALIHLMLPEARIIDARRHPLACGFSCFKQHFARGQHFSYDLADLGHYYRDYVRLMAHFDAVLPGRVHRVLHEALVEDTEAQVRALLAYCRLPWDDRCLRFYENRRAVATASSEQVRQPISREGLDQWRHFDPWLAPLRAALGDVLDAYPSIPPIL